MDRVRKSHIDFNQDDWKEFIDTVKKLKASTEKKNYDYFAEIHIHHRHKGQAHERYTFLPWHREYLLVFEDALRKISPNVTLPYWDWTKNPEIPAELSDASEWGVVRVMSKGDRISSKRKDDVALAMTKTTYPAFHDRINGPHGAVHVQIGGWDQIGNKPIGEMADIGNSPRDILFWLHHAYLDKVWDDWSTINPNRLPPDGCAPETSITSRLLPTNALKRTSRQVLSVNDLFYSYK